MIKNKVFLLVFFSFFILFDNYSYAQTQKSIESQTDSLVSHFQILKTKKLDTDIKYISSQIDSLFVILLSNETSFEDSLTKLNKFSSILLSEDKKLRIITWNTYNSLGEYLYFGYIQFFSEDDNKFHFVKLIDESMNIINAQNSNLDANKWFGCLYYQIITTNYKKNKYYTLLGWDGNNFTTKKRIIEVITINNSNPKFGYNFKLGNQKSERLIFEFNRQVTMTLKWNKKNKMIIWDHLSPISPKYEGMPEYYGPDFTQDALKFKKGKWLFLEDINIKNPKN